MLDVFLGDDSALFLSGHVNGMLFLSKMVYNKVGGLKSSFGVSSDQFKLSFKGTW